MTTVRGIDWDHIGAGVGTVSYEACAGVSGLGHYFHRLNGGIAKRKDNENQCSSEEGVDRGQESGIPLEPQIVKNVYRKIRAVETELVSLLLKRLRSNPHVIIIEENRKQGTSLTTNKDCYRLPIVSFCHDVISPKGIYTFLDERGIICRYGQFLSKGVMDLFGVKNVVRFSLAHYNTVNEVERVFEVLETMQDWRSDQ